MSQRTFVFGIVFAIMLHLVIVGLFAFDVIPQQYHREGYRLWFHQGGDSYGYYEQAQSIVTGEFSPNKYPLGFPALIAPIISLLQPESHDELVEPIAGLWALILFPIAQVILGWLSLAITKRRGIALTSVYLWTLLPIISYLVLAFLWNPELAEVTSVHFIWAQMLSDGPATFFTLLAFSTYWRARQTDFAWRWVIITGLLCGLIVLIRLTGVIALFTIVILLLMEKRIWALLAIIALAGLVFAPQLIYNHTFFGNPLTSGYSVLDELPAAGLFSPQYLLEGIQSLGSRFGIGLIFLSLVAIGGIGLVLWQIWQWERIASALLGFWIAGYLVIYSIYYYSWQGGLSRFLMPIYPALAIIVAVLLWILIAKRRENLKESHA